MITLTRILSLAAAGDSSGSRNADIKMTPLLFAVARWLSTFFGTRTIGIETPASAVGKTCDLSEGRFWDADAFGLGDFFVARRDVGLGSKS